MADFSFLFSIAGMTEEHKTGLERRWKIAERWHKVRAHPTQVSIKWSYYAHDREHVLFHFYRWDDHFKENRNELILDCHVLYGHATIDRGSQLIYGQNEYRRQADEQINVLRLYGFNTEE